MDGPLWQELWELRRQDLLREAERARLVGTALGPRRMPGLHALSARLLAVVTRRGAVSESTVVPFSNPGKASGSRRRVPPGARRCRSRAA